MSESTKVHPLPSMIEDPPVSIGGILARLGPGLIIAGSIVGSGELIGTTKTGAEAGFWLLWLIIIGCIIKVFVQVELGRDAIVRGKTTMEAMGDVPGPRLAGRGNWLLWYYFAMFAISLGQLGGIVGGVGQAMAISVPLTENGRQFNARVDLLRRIDVKKAEWRLAEAKAANPADEAAANERFGKDLKALEDRLATLPSPKESYDDRIWAAIIAVVTSVLLVVGHYRLIEWATTLLVALFTAMTVITVLMLQTTQSWSIGMQDLANGMSFRLPPQGDSQQALATALKTFGIIGVGANELISYPYWCLEKGYARFTGHRDESDGWAARARGWMNVLRWDAWCSMVVYTLATVAFYLLGAAVLGRSGINPAGNDLIRTLSVMYEPIFGQWTQPIFLLGAFAVLYSTFFVANAGHARVFSDGLRVVGFLARDEKSKRRQVKFLSGFLPLLCLAIYLVFPKQPEKLVLLSGMMQALMLPMLAAAALYFRYRKCDDRVCPNRAWDLFLWVSSLGMLAAAICLLYVDRAGITALFTSTIHYLRNLI